MKMRLLLSLVIAASLPAQVTYDRLLHAGNEPQNWLTYSGTYLGQRYSQLSQITAANAKDLGLEWIFQARSLEKFEATPLVVDGIMYVTQAPNDIVALDAVTGRIFWIYNYNLSPQASPCCGRVNRGLAILGNTLYMGTVDAHVVAVDAKSGRELWNTQLVGQEAGAWYSITHAPLVVKDKVIVGMAGGEREIRGFLAALDITTGKQVWRFNTTAGPGEPGHESWEGDNWQRGGASVWVTGSYDPDLNLTYWGLGNPPWMRDVRPDSNLYTDCVVALDADTGKLKWYFQFTPGDQLDHDSTQIPVLVDMEWQGKPRKLMLWANRNGFTYVLDRATGEFLRGQPFAKLNWASGLDAKGHPIRIPGMEPTPQGTVIYPGLQGATNWYSPSYSPHTGLFYIPTWENYHTTFIRAPGPVSDGRQTYAVQPRTPIPGLVRPPIVSWSEEDGYGVVRAIDPRTGEKKWDFRMSDVTDSGILTTAADVLFTGGREGYFYALDARTGALLWKATVGGVVASGPITYSVAGKQYVAIAAGNSLFSFALRQ